MKFYKIFIIIFLAIAISSCDDEKKNNSPTFSLKIDAKSKKLQVSSPLKATVSASKNAVISEIVFYLNDTELEDTDANPLSLATTIPNTSLLGNQELRSVITYDEGKSAEQTTKITVLADKKPKIYTYKIVNMYPHDINAYTQGLEFYRDTLFESTGQRGQSSLRKVNYKTGEVYQKVDLNRNYFGEGITVLNNKLYMLTWQANTGFIFNPDNLQRLDTFTYQDSKEGWGLCNDGKKLYKSDGTEYIWTLDPETLKEEHAIQVTDHKRVYVKANELEFVNGKIYANSYMNPSVMIVNPKNGALEGIIDFRGLKEKVTDHPEIDVLNGIAFNPETNTLFVTGKYWDKLFEVEIVEK